MEGSGGCRLDIHCVYAGVRWILIGYVLGVYWCQADTDWIFIGCTQGSDRYQLDIHWVYEWVRRLPTEYWLDVCRSPVDTDQILIVCTQGSGGYRLHIHWVYAVVRWIWMNIHWVYAGVQQILIKYSLHVRWGQVDTEWIFIRCTQGSGVYQLDIYWVYAVVRRWEGTAFDLGGIPVKVGGNTDNVKWSKYRQAETGNYQLTKL